jgi:signal transduction histidine kinase
VKRFSVVERVVAVAASVAVLVSIVVAGALVAVVSARHAESRQTHAKDVTEQTLRVENLAVELESAVRGYTLSGNVRFLRLFGNARDSLSPQLARLQKLVADDEPQLARVQAAGKQLNSYVSDYAEPVIHIRDVSPAAARGEVSGNVDKFRSQEIRATLGSILAAEDARSAAAARHAQSVSRTAEIVSALAVVLSAAVILLFGAWVARAVAEPVRRTAAAAAQVATGDFGVRVEEGAAGEVGDLVAAFNSMTRALEAGRRELVEQNELLRASEQHKRDLISMVSHDIRTPLSSVIGFTALLLERDFPPEEQRRYLEIVDQQARRLASLAGDFLDVQLLEGGGITLDRDPFDLVDAVREQTHLFFSHLDTHDVELDVPGSPVVVNGDRDRVAQVIDNLVSNAIKYSPDGGVVTVSLSLDGSSAVLAVTDPGIGIADGDRDRIFEKFFRAEEAAAATGGTGLGLAVAREIVESHGGAISVRSKPGSGSTFTVTLPVANAVPAGRA